MAKYIRQRGTLDVYENDANAFQFISQKAIEMAKRYNYKPIITPTFESTGLYSRATGETSDIVTKEMYSFKDKGNRDISLRPEGTAGVIRAVIENKLYATNDLPLKYYYNGPFFRYERPGAGRYREFYQFGLEVIGSNSYYDDCESILFIVDYFNSLNIKDFTIRINTFGNVTCRNAHRDAIKNFFTPHIDNLCEDCKVRYNSNPLRILDCKVDADYFKNLDIPTSLDSLDDENKQVYEKIKTILKENNVNFIEDKYLVRGLDYYTGIIFEVDVTLKDGKVLTIGGGGRYSNLVKELDGPDLNCVGFGLGLSRIQLVLADQYGIDNYAIPLDYYVMPLSEMCMAKCVKITQTLRSKGYNVVLENSKKSVSSMFKYASRNKFKFAVIVGDDELVNNNVKIKNLETQEQYFVPLSEFLGG